MNKNFSVIVVYVKEDFKNVPANSTAVAVILFFRCLETK